MNQGYKPLSETNTILVLSHKEDTSRLVGFLSASNFVCVEFRQCLKGREARYSAAAKCLLAHMSAWRWIIEQSRPAIVVEADFVPARGFARLPSPRDIGPPPRCAWLYSSAQRIYRVVSPYFALGQSATTVAMYWEPDSAALALEFGIREISMHRGAYTAWDTYLRPELKKAGLKTYLIPLKSYGEHDGSPNPEHRILGGMNPSHHADCLYGPLAFYPRYSKGSKTRFREIRIRAWTRAIARLLLGRYIESTTLFGQQVGLQDRVRLLRFSLSRLLLPHTPLRSKPPVKSAISGTSQGPSD